MKELKFNHLLQNLKTDKQAVKEIYEEYYPKIIIHLSRRFGKLISPVDIAHDTFLALMSAENFSYVEYPTTWLYTMADNKAIDALKRKNQETTRKFQRTLSVGRAGFKRGRKKEPAQSRPGIADDHIPTYLGRLQPQRNRGFSAPILRKRAHQGKQGVRRFKKLFVTFCPFFPTV